MHIVTVVFGPATTPLTLFYREEAAALIAFTALNDGSVLVVDVADDYGQRASLICQSIHAVLLEDPEKSGDAAIDRSLIQARTQARAETLAQADPVLKMAMARRGPMGPPGMNGAFPRQ